MELRLPRTAITVAAMILTAILFAWIFHQCGSHPTNLQPATRHLDDSLTKTAPAFEAARRDRAAREDSLKRLSHVKEASSHAAELSGASLREIAAARADSARRHSTSAADSARFYAQAYEDERAAGLETSRALAEERAAHAETKRALSVADSTIHADSARIVALRFDITNLRRDLARATDCRLALGIPCPSRTVAFLAGAATTGAVAVVVWRATKTDRVIVLRARVPL
jgi:hypothetical protein